MILDLGMIRLLEDDTLSDDAKKCDAFGSQSTSNLPFRFSWDTRYIGGKQMVVVLNWTRQSQWYSMKVETLNRRILKNGRKKWRYANDYIG